MAELEVLQRYYQMDLVDRTIVNIVEKLEGEITQSDFGKVKTAASIQEGIRLRQYRTGVTGMGTESLNKEEHSSARLGAHLVCRFGKRPNNVHAHAIVAGKHPLSANTRLIMAKHKIRIDDADNGCWLPDSSKHCPHPAMR